MNCDKHRVMMNVDTDAAIGADFKAQADKPDIVCPGAGDEPASFKEPAKIVTAMGHTIVSAGKGKINPLHARAAPDECKSESDARRMGARMPVEFVDGSKTKVELAAIAIADGLVPDRTGMHGPSAGPDDLSATIIPQRDGGTSSDDGRVDHLVGKGLAPAVLVTAEAEHFRTGSG